MAYATVEDIQDRIIRDLSDKEIEVCEQLLEDAVDIINAYNSKAEEEAKKIVSINMVKRMVATVDPMPIGATQGSVSALGYSQSFTFGNGGSGEMYLSKVDKKLLGVSNRIGARSPLEVSNDSGNNCCAL